MSNRLYRNKYDSGLIEIFAERTIGSTFRLGAALDSLAALTSRGGALNVSISLRERKTRCIRAALVMGKRSVKRRNGCGD